MTRNSIDERGRERRFPFGFASRLEHILHRQRHDEADAEAMLIETEARIAALHDQEAA